MSVTDPRLAEALDLLREAMAEVERLEAELKRLRRPSWRQRLIAWIDPGPEADCRIRPLTAEEEELERW